ncbi:unnamed protein product [Oppiella nova]|uniref:Rho guanine nucleotide exchange factor 7 n=1 Tax=Oppiella nova TaxID=334625 RepID=A0A7R9Q9L3_9ACAR|nr:unnamed protein product [Oppiella nova]CAG2160425.1 unnamed protein product [Oppiella nova]
MDTSGDNVRSLSSVADMGSNAVMNNGNAIKLVKAIYNFKPTNNDELCFNKDDIITLTQWPSGGWWEGTLNGITGWFPSNYCQPLTTSDTELKDSGVSHVITGATNSHDTDSQQYRQMVFQDIEDTESAYVRDIMDTINRYLKPLQLSQILPENDINAIIRIVQEISSVHRRFLVTLNGLNSLPHKEVRIGGVFLEFAPHIKAVHLDYCANHAKFVHSIEKYKKDICTLFNGMNPSDNNAGNVQLTSCLSASFRRIDKYPALLQELQRYTDESHIDRGDTQRAGFVYRDLSMSCLELRRRKEMELEVMLGNIKNWDQGMKNIQTFGEIIRMDSVSIQIIPDYSEMKKDRYLVLFPQILLVLSVSTEMTSFVFESKLRLEDAVIKTSGELMDATNIFEITSTEEKTTGAQTTNISFIIQCPTIEDSKHWIELLQKYILHSQTLKHNPSAGVLHANHGSDSTGHRSAVPSIQSEGSTTSSAIILNTSQSSQRIAGQTPHITRSNIYWTNKCLLPHPPTRIRPHSGTTGANTPAAVSKKGNLSANEDMLILQVIESYCNKGRVRQPSSAAYSDSPQVYVVDEDRPNTGSNSSVNSLHKNGETVNTEMDIRNELRQMKMD